MPRALTVLAGVLLLSLGVQAQGTVFWRMNIVSSAHPSYGFQFFDSSRVTPNQWTVAFAPRAGPGGRDAVRVHLNGLASGGFGANVWEGTTAPQLAQGGRRYYRYYACYSRVVDIRRAQDGGFWGVKDLLVNAPTNGERVIATTAPHTAALNLQLRIGKNINGPPDETVGNPDPFLVLGCNAVQYGVFTSTTTSSGNGGYRIWLNNDNQATPSASSSFTTSMNASAQGGASLLNTMEPSRVSFDILIAGFEIGDTFDSGWFSRMGSPSTPIPGPPGKPLWTTL